MGEIEKLRNEIDAIDEETLKLLNKRSRIVLDIANIKRNTKSKFYSPERERQILERLTSLNKGPFPNDALKSIYRDTLSLFIA